MDISRVRRTTRAVAVTVAMGLVVTLAQAVPATAVPLKRTAPATQVTEPVDGQGVTAEPAPSDPDAASGAATSPQAAQWPSTQPVTVDLATAPPGAFRRAGATPVRLATATATATGAGTARARHVTIDVAEPAAARAAGVHGLLMQVSSDGAPGGEPLRMSVDYSAFEDVYGGDWASRLRLVELPACALTTPAEPACQSGRPLDTDLDTAARTASADITAPATPQTAASATDPAANRSMAAAAAAPSDGGGVFALAATPAGGAGDYSATPLSPASSWLANAQTGDFTWAHPLPTPPSVGGPAPDLTIAYSSGSVDGRVASTNNQASWIGEGHDLTSGYVERRYVSCADDMTGGNNTTKTGDLCWLNDNALLVLQGRSSEVIRDSATGTWRLKDDDASRFERLTGAPNGDNDGEHWRLTTTDGVQYYFGLTKRYAADTANTASTWTVPVFGNHTGEPCRQPGYAASSCAQAWRWNLDYVVDTHANTMTYFYAAEINSYGRNLNTAVSGYTRGGYLTRIDYGQRRGSEHTTPAPSQVTFGTSERCLPSGTITCDPAQLTSANAAHWPDVPFDQICTSATTCPNRMSPTFFTRKRLTDVTTKTWNGTGHVPVDSWTLTQEFRDPGDGTSKHLWLAAIQHTGHTGTPVTTPPITFTGVQMPNRVDGLDVAPPLVKWRVSSVNTETGATISVNYTPAECVAGSNVPAAPENNTKRCFPVFYTPEGAAQPSLHYFHKYLVASMVEDDRTGGGLPKVSRYTYNDAPAWHYDDTILTLPKYRTWGQWRGYGSVDVTVGNAAARLHTRYLYLRGMDDDVLPGGARRNVVVTDSRGGTVEDQPQLAGFLREQITYSSQGGPEVESTLNDPWLSGVTANNGTTQARITGVAATSTRTALTAGGYRTTQVLTSYDEHGQPLTLNDLGDVAVATDDLCTRTSYAKNTSAWILDTTAQVETVSKSCAVAPTRPGDVLSQTRNFYDGATAHTTAPVRGDITKVESLADTPTGPVSRTVTRSIYDAHGRPTETYDALDRKTSVAYTPATGGPVISTATTNAAGHVTTTTLEPSRGLPVVETDPNGKRTELAYDGLGRLTALWLPGRNRSAGATPNSTHEYLVRADGPTVVTTKELRNDGTYTASYTLYDGLLRPRQTQAPAAGAAGGRVLTDTVYDDRGLPVDANGPYYNDQPPGTALLLVADNQQPAQTRTTYDGAGRPTVTAFRSNGTEKWRTTTSYGGDRTHLDPPAGATPTTAITDARGNTTALRQYKGTAPTGAYDETRYTYDPAGRRTSIVDAAGNTWRKAYDRLGNETRTEDPDRGVTTTTYDAAGQVSTTTDARGKTLAYTYDVLGRKTTLREGSLTGAKRAEWTYDTLAKGLPTGATRYDGANAYTHAVTGYDDSYRTTASTLTIPASEGALAGTYTSLFAYNLDGTLRAKQQPAVPGLSGETLTYTYDNLGLPSRLAGNGAYVSAVTRSPYGEALQYDFGNTVGYASWQTFFYEEGTRRLQRRLLDRQNVATTDADTTYAWDTAGNLTRIADTPAGGTPDTQCFRYDYLRRLTEAWTATDACAAGPSLTVLGSNAAYWTTYTHDLTGNRLTEVAHAAAGDTTRTYTHPAARAARPHTTTAVTTTAPAKTATTDTYGYDATGNTTSRALAGKTAQTLTWDTEGELTGVTAGTATSSYLYDAGGQRLIRREPGAVTLYLDGAEIRLTTATTALATTRYYTFDGKTVATRSTAGVQLLAADHHGTGEYAIAATNGAITKRRFSPYGAPRGTGTGTWPGQKGFVGGTTDPATDLTLLGARYHDPAIGAFISVDPLLDVGDPQQMHGYAYANNNPASFSDPDGLMPRGFDGLDAITITRLYGITDRTKMGMPPTTTRTPQRQAAQARSSSTTNGSSASRSNGNTRPTNERAATNNRPRPSNALPRPRPRPEFNFAREAAQLALEVIGVTDLQNCVTDGDLGACASMIAGNLPIGKAFKAARSLYRLADRYMDYRKNLRGWEAATRADEGGALVKYDREFASRNLLSQVGEGYGKTPGGRTVSAHAADRIVNGAPGRSPTTVERVDDILSNPTRTVYQESNDTVRVYQGKDWVVVSGTGPQHIVTVMIR